jgi:hypothetical protein
MTSVTHHKEEISIKMKETRIFIINIWSPEVHLPFKWGVKALRNENGRKKKKRIV